VDYFGAIDIGASSGVLVVGWIEDSKIKLEEVYRFENGYQERNGRYSWNISLLFSNIITGLKMCKEKKFYLKSLAIDTWGVDYVLLDKYDKIVGDCVSYRDPKTKQYINEYKNYFDEKELYKLTGIQKQLFNSIYQLLVTKINNPEHLENAESLLMIPDYLSFLLTGFKSQEYTNATTTSLVNVNTNEWDMDFIESLGLPKKLFAENLKQPGDTIGILKKEISDIVGFECQVIHAPSHDTASAFVAIPTIDKESIYISSGTWSLVGVENSKAITTDLSRNLNFTNEGGYQYNYRFIKNIMGLWLIQNCKKVWGDKYSYSDLEQLAKNSNLSETVIIDVNDPSLYAPNNMVEAIKSICNVKLESEGDIVKCVYQSLAFSYSQTCEMIKKMTGKKYKRIHIVGGGSKDSYLNQLTSNLTNLDVIAGPVEGSSLGNLVTQFISFGKIKNLQEARKMICESFDLRYFKPEKGVKNEVNL